MFTQEQIQALQEKLDSSKVKTKPDSSKSLYLRSSYVLEQANKIFGYDGWGYEVISIEFMEAVRKSGEIAGAYKSLVKVWVKGCDFHRTDVGFGICATNSPEAHETAFKAAATDGVKRALRTFGDQFGLSLYDPEDVEEIKQEQRQAARPAQAQPSQRLAATAQIRQPEPAKTAPAPNANSAISKAQFAAWIREIWELPENAQEELIEAMGMVATKIGCPVTLSEQADKWLKAGNADPWRELLRRYVQAENKAMTGFKWAWNETEKQPELIPF